MKYVCEFLENINLKQNSNDEMKYELSALKWNKKTRQIVRNIINLNI